MADLRGASADALADLEAGLGDDVPGSELFGIAGLLRSEPALRRVLTDVSVAPDAKAGLAHQVLDGRAAAPVVDLVADAVRRRWTRSRDLADSLEQLGVVAVVRSASASEGETDRLSDELFAVQQVVVDHPDLRDALSDPARSVADKQALVAGLLDGKALPATVELVQQSLAGSYRTVPAALAAYEKVAADVHQRGVATVRVAVPLAEDERRRLAEALQRQYDRPVHLNVVVDPQVLGGVRVEIGDDVIDGTVRTRLDDARRRLAG